LHAKPYERARRAARWNASGAAARKKLSTTSGRWHRWPTSKQARAWLERFYQGAPHAGILAVLRQHGFAEGDKVRVAEQQLREALTVRVRDAFGRYDITVGGAVYEVRSATRRPLVTIATSLFDGKEPILELDNKRIALGTVDPVPQRQDAPPATPARSQPADHPVDFEPGKTLEANERRIAMTASSICWSASVFALALHQGD